MFFRAAASLKMEKTMKIKTRNRRLAKLLRQVSDILFQCDELAGPECVNDECFHDLERHIAQEMCNLAWLAQAAENIVNSK